MGFAVAEAAARAGAEVTLVAGPVNLPTPAGVARVDVESALDMYDAVIARAAQSTVFIGVAAVADYRSDNTAEHKIKKTDDNHQLSIALVRNPDILATVAQLPNGPFTVGFAAETQNVADYARGKLRNKQLNMIAANHVGGETGFNSADNAMDVYWGEFGHQHLPRAAKTEIARQLIALLAERLTVCDAAPPALHIATDVPTPLNNGY
jgi:phosphopantothenoylcysteine decarboxylase/phosphopantothenate--cysteine ligase